MQKSLTFEAIPQAILELIDKVDTIQADISELKERHIPKVEEALIGIDEACKILNRAKSTLYALTQAHKIPDYLKSLSHQLQNEPNRPSVSLGDAFCLQFRVKENDNDTNWVERINNVGSDGTDILVKAMVNIMLINVFKKKAVCGYSSDKKIYNEICKRIITVLPLLWICQGHD